MLGKMVPVPQNDANGTGGFPGMITVYNGQLIGRGERLPAPDESFQLNF